jgi:transposase-like protein
MNDLTNEPLGDETFTEVDKKTGELVTYCVFSGEVVNKQSYSSDLATRYKYCPEIGDAISDLMRTGSTITDIAKMENMPNAAVIYRWRRRYPDFARSLREAREDRAEYFADKMVSTIEAATDKEDISIAKEQVKVYQWQAERANPTDYAPKREVKIEAEIRTVPMYVIETGIDRSPPVTENIVDAVFSEVTDDEISKDGGADV